jgi:UPF0271 protein
MGDSIDLNCDLGEGFGRYEMGDDAAMLEIVTSVNVACGFHAGDPDIMAERAAQTLEKGIVLGAHPSFDDLHGFGRRRIQGIPNQELHNLIIYQVGALQGIARSVGQKVTHVRAHGALGNMTDEQPELAEVLAGAIAAMDSDIALMTMAGCAADVAARALGLKVARQAFADRAYNDDGTLVSRSLPGAVLEDVAAATERVIRLAEEGTIETINGEALQLDARVVCVHGDSPAAVKMAESIRSALENRGISVKPYTRHDGWN